MKRRIFCLAIVVMMMAAMCACSSKSSADINVEAFPKFTSIDLEGNEVSSDIFANADVTVVNIWGTYCNPCINEMPELAKWAEEMPDNVQIIGIAADVRDKDSKEYALAQDIVKEAGVKYTNIIENEELDDVVLQIVGVPTTFFVDKEGNVIAEPVTGAYVDTYKERLESVL